MTPPRLFEEYAGHFWGILETRDYMRARFAHVEGLMKVKDYAAIDAALDHLLDMLRLCRSDNVGVRDLVPAMFLRLGKEQRCYDFCVWCATTCTESNYDWGNMDLPFLNVRNADVFEPDSGKFVRKYGHLSHVVAITLLKIRLFFKLRAYQDASLLSEKGSQEILDNVRDQLICGTALEHRKDVLTTEDQSSFIRELQKQIELLFAYVNDQNMHFWSALLKPGRSLTARPQSHNHVSVEELQLVLQYNYDAWTETPGALDILEKLKAQE